MTLFCSIILQYIFLYSTATKKLNFLVILFLQNMGKLKIVIVIYSLFSFILKVPIFSTEKRKMSIGL
jgi:hypothetical protein